MSGNGAAGAWWEDPTTDWTAGEPGRVADVLAAAFPEAAGIRALAGRAGVDADILPALGSARDAWALALRTAGGSGRVLHLMAEVLQDDGSREFRRPLVARLGDQLRVVDAIRSIRFGVDAREGLAGVVEEIGDEPVGALQAITSAPSGLEDPRAVVQSLLEAMWRTAMIEIGGVPRGTGFLVGPDLVLTAAHVIEDRRWPPVPPPEVTARFDYILDPGTSLAETGVPVPVSEIVTGSLPAPEEVNGVTREWNAPADRLDFAVLRLARTVPPVDDRGVQRPRGGYGLVAVEYAFAGSPMLFIVQHPLGDTQRVTWVRSVAQLNDLGTRIRYGGNTLPGSSGSAVVDPRGRLVAVHHYSAASRNQAVPVSAIAKHLADENFGDLFSPAAAGAMRAAAAATAADIDPFRTTALGGRAFVNRNRLRTSIKRMATDDGAERLLTIQGQPGSGMSYSYRLLAHVAGRSKACAALREVAPDGLAIVPLDLGSYVAIDVGERAGRVMRDLLHDLGLDYSGEAWAQISRDASSLERELRRGLRGSGTQWWIFVDGLEELVAIKQGGVDEVICALAKAADDPALPLRLVLVGPEAWTFAADHGLVVAEDVAAGLVRQDVERWFTDRAREEGRDVDQVRLQVMLADLFPVDGPLPVPAVVGPRLPRRLQELLEGHDGP